MKRELSAGAREQAGCLPYAISDSQANWRQQHSYSGSLNYLLKNRTLSTIETDKKEKKNEHRKITVKK